MDKQIPHWLVVANPISGKRKLKHIWPDIQEGLEKADINYTTIFTTKVNHARDSVRSGVEAGVRNILIIGGDGTINEVVNGIYLSSIAEKNKIVLGLIPNGTGNDWARQCRIPFQHKEALKVFLAGKIQQTDLIKVSYWSKDLCHLKSFYFLNEANLGLGARVAQATDRITRKIFLSSLVFLVNLIILVIRFQPHTLKIVTHGKVIYKQKTLSCCIANGKYSGGGLMQAPLAEPSDGQIDLMLVRPLKLQEMPQAFRCLLKGEFHLHPAVKRVPLSKFEIVSGYSPMLDTDGVLRQKRFPYYIEVIPQGICFMINDKPLFK